MTNKTTKRVVKRAVKKSVKKATVTKLEVEATDSAMKQALKDAVADTRKGESPVEQITTDAGEVIVHETEGLKKASETDEFMVLENSESLRFALGQSANSLSYFGLRNLVWVAAITDLDFDEIVSESAFEPAAQIAADYRSYFTRGDTDDHQTMAGVDRVDGSDDDGRSDMHDADSMDSGTDSRKRLSESQFDIMSQNADRYLACAAALSRLAEYGIQPTQPIHDYKNQSGKTVKGTMTRVIDWHTNYIAERRVKQQQQHAGKSVRVSKATADLGASSLSAFGL